MTGMRVRGTSFMKVMVAKECRLVITGIRFALFFVSIEGKV